MPKYPESQLVLNRASVLVFGGGEADRRAWAMEAASSLGLSQLTEAKDDAALARAQRSNQGVVYVPDAQVLSAGAQRELVRVMRQQEERPKFVVGLGMAPDAALQKGLLRDDLHFALHRAQVDLSDGELKATLKKRRAKAGKMK